MYSSLRSVLFKMNPEIAHDWTIRSLKLMQSTPGMTSLYHSWMGVRDARLISKRWGITFPNPVGLAAGFDKHATVYPALASLGFGFVEVGTLTPRPQPGNPLPRLFRLPEDQALINRMGFNNHGVEQAKMSLERLKKPSIPLGINLGKNKDTPNQIAASDYQKGLSTLYPYGDYFVINISSPNTQGLRDLQHVESLQQLITDILSTRSQLVEKYQQHKPILVKVAPDLSKEALTDIIQVAHQMKVDGIIATNTTLSRDHLHSQHQQETGGLSGRPLSQRSTDFIRHIYQLTQGNLPIMGVGGIFTGTDAYEKIRAGASLIQVYTGMMYRGPSIAKFINQELLALLEKDQLSSIDEAVGLDA
ncbi:quinone-dependent dihydroorotate dehydrogenase [Hazenella coriacea]|uniref:quinone-dependent dihydroorotate dehydrogenase n=1 Tax=Hazenella coriacea TaxID=1179467 RepID=UPI001043C44E|nr:quinone-dependent dihydroorotate dehydrogenase [Hazenella coriacea]